MSYVLLGKDLLGALSNVRSSSLAHNLIIEGICIDSRSAAKGSLFFAIKGSTNDGHDYIADAARRGAVCAIISHATPELIELLASLSISYIQVEDVILALQDLAQYRRRTVLSEAKVIAVTGSLGKTTVTKAIYEVLSRFFPSHHPERNLNNHIGMPLVLASTPNDTKVIVLEMGMNNAGEIEVLSKIARPNVAVITTIASAHIGNFGGDVNGIIKAKAEIFAGMNERGIVFLNEANEHFSKLYALAKAAGLTSIFRVGVPDKSQIFISSYNVTPLCTSEYTVIVREQGGNKEAKCYINGIGYHNAFNTMFAFAVARLFKIEPTIVAKIVAKIPKLEGRGNIEHVFYDKKHIVVIDDSYNCSPDALHSSINILSILKEQNYPQGRTVCVVADMADLGSDVEVYYAEIAATIKDCKIDKVIAVGENMSAMYNTLPEEVRYANFTHSGLLVKKIRGMLQDGDIVLFKGSRFMKLEIAINKLYR